MDNLIEMTDQELATRIVNYIERIRLLEQDVSEYFDGNINVSTVVRIQTEYSAIKQAIRSDAQYLNLVRNEKGYRDDSLYTLYFKPSITEASASGFTSPTNSKINQKFFSSLYDAEYKLTKYYNYDDWKDIAHGTMMLK